MHRGYITIWRKVVDNPLYFSEKFTKWQAWIDLLILANHKDRFVPLRGISVFVKRGQVIAGRKFLSERWQWSEGKVTRFLEFLDKTVQQIEQQKTNVTNLVTIINYNQYNKAIQQTEQQTEQQVNNKRTASEQQTNTPNNNKELQTQQETIKKTFKNYTEKDFIDEVESFTEYGNSIIEGFLNYWLEKNTKGKMRFQTNQTWETSRRLKTWSNNNFNKQPEKIYPGGHTESDLDELAGLIVYGDRR